MSGNRRRIGDNLTDVKIKNRSLVLRLVKKRRLLARIELARITGLTQPTITNIANELIASRLLLEVGTSDTRSGRKPILLSFNDKAFYVIAISFTRRGFSVALTDLQPTILYRRDSSYSILDNTEIALLELQKEFIHVLEYATHSLRLILGIGVSSPGPVDPDTCTILSHPTYLNHRNLDLRSYLREYDLPLFMMNDADAACLHETWNGEGKECRNLVFFMVGENVGGGVVIDGKLYDGKKHKAAEVGHLCVNLFGPRCVCGNRGCLEMYCGVPSILEKAREAAWFGKSSFLKSFLSGSSDLQFSQLVEGGKQGDKICLNLLDQLGQHVGAGVVNLINLYGPEKVVIGGELVLARSFIEKSVERIIRERTFYRDYASPEISFSRWGIDTALLGSASIILDHFIAGELGRF
ncbi:MAG TPA: ROK family protein [Atribacteraceae bacterium]|nr:ROK family protein [Atribacteraceae bacterium]